MVMGGGDGVGGMGAIAAAVIEALARELEHSQVRKDDVGGVRDAGVRDGEGIRDRIRGMPNSRNIGIYGYVLIYYSRRVMQSSDFAFYTI